MDTRAFVLSVSLTGMIGVADVASGQHEAHQAGGAATPSAAQVADCRQAQPVVAGLLSAALKRLEDARLTNNAAAMRDAADDVQAALVDMRTQLAPCSVMQAAAAANAGAAMPATPASPAVPAPATRMPATQPGAAAAPPAAADPHAGHAAPAAPAASTSRAPAARPSTPARPAPRASDAHAGHAMPPAAAPKAAPPASGRPSAAAPPTNIAELKCANAVDPKTAPRMLYQGRMYYFCTDASRAEFAKDPAKFVTAPPAAAPAHAH